jgi:hypothetical protein
MDYNSSAGEWRRRLIREKTAFENPGSFAGRRPSFGGRRDAGDWNWHVHDHDPDRGRCSRHPAGSIDAKLGDTVYTEAPISAGSMSTASIGPAVEKTAPEVRQKLIQRAVNDTQSPLHGAEAGMRSSRMADCF